MNEPTAIANYQIIERLGQGAMGTVYRAERDGQEVAIKVLRSDLADDDEIIRRFLRERNVLVSLDSDRLVRIHNLVVDGGIAAIVMDLVDGGDLAQYLDRRGALAPADAAAKMAAVFEALAVCHEAGVLHRDVKPENVLLDRHGEPHLADFGIARLADRPGLTAVQGIVGTPFYIAPEVVKGEEPGPPCDVYSAGIVLFELVEGMRPFRDANTYALLRQHVDGDIPKPERMPSELFDLFLTLVDKDPMARPTASAAAASLAVLSSELLEATVDANLSDFDSDVVPGPLREPESTIVKGSAASSKASFDDGNHETALTNVESRAVVAETIVKGGGSIAALAADDEIVGLIVPQGSQTIVKPRGGDTEEAEPRSNVNDDESSEAKELDHPEEAISTGQVGVAAVLSGETIVKPVMRQTPGGGDNQKGDPAQSGVRQPARGLNDASQTRKVLPPKAPSFDEDRKSKRGILIGGGVAAGLLLLGGVAALGSTSGTAPQQVATKTPPPVPKPTTTTTTVRRHHHVGGTPTPVTTPTTTPTTSTTQPTETTQSSGGSGGVSNPTVHKTPPITRPTTPTTVSIPMATSFSIGSNYVPFTTGAGCSGHISVSASAAGGSTSGEVANWDVGGATGSGWSFTPSQFFYPGQTGITVPITLTVTSGGGQVGNPLTTSIGISKC